MSAYNASPLGHSSDGPHQPVSEEVVRKDGLTLYWRNGLLHKVLSPNGLRTFEYDDHSLKAVTDDCGRFLFRAELPDQNGNAVWLLHERKRGAEFTELEEVARIYGKTTVSSRGDVLIATRMEQLVSPKRSRTSKYFKFDELKMRRQIPVHTEYIPTGGDIQTAAPPSRVGTRRHAESLQTATSSYDVQRIFAAIYPRLPHDQHGWISRPEINKALENQAFKGEEAQVLALISAKYDGFIALKKDGSHMLRGEHISAMQQLYSSPHRTDQEAMFIKEVDRFLEQAKERIESAAEALFPLGIRSVHPKAINRTQVTSSAFDIALASLAATNPAAIVDMVHQNRDGTYTIQFPATPQESVTVTGPTQSEIARFGAHPEDGLWPWVLRKAYTKWSLKSSFRRHIENAVGDRSIADLITCEKIFVAQ